MIIECKLQNQKLFWEMHTSPYPDYKQDNWRAINHSTLLLDQKRRAPFDGVLPEMIQYKSGMLSIKFRPVDYTQIAILEHCFHQGPRDVETVGLGEYRNSYSRDHAMSKWVLT